MSEELNNDNICDRLLVIGATMSKFANTMTQVVKVIATAVKLPQDQITSLNQTATQKDSTIATKDKAFAEKKVTIRYLNERVDAWSDPNDSLTTQLAAARRKIHNAQSQTSCQKRKTLAKIKDKADIKRACIMQDKAFGKIMALIAKLDSRPLTR